MAKMTLLVIHHGCKMPQNSAVMFSQLYGSIWACQWSQSVSIPNTFLIGVCISDLLGIHGNAKIFTHTDHGIYIQLTLGPVSWNREEVVILIFQSHGIFQSMGILIKQHKSYIS